MPVAAAVVRANEAEVRVSGANDRDRVTAAQEEPRPTAVQDGLLHWTSRRMIFALGATLIGGFALIIAGLLRHREEVWGVGAIVLGTLAIVVVLAASLVRQLWRHQSVAAELATSRRWLERAQAAAHIGSWVTQFSGRDVWSPETYRLFGVDPKTFVPSVAAFESLVHPDDLGRARDAARQSIKTGARYNLVHRIVRPDGTVRWVHAQADVIRDAQGRTIQMVGTVQDVTEGKIAEDALRLSEARLRDYAETASDWYWETGPDDRFTFLSSRLKAFGMDNNVRLGKTRRDLASDVDEDRRSGTRSRPRLHAGSRSVILSIAPACRAKSVRESTVRSAASRCLMPRAISWAIAARPVTSPR